MICPLSPITGAGSRPTSMETTKTPPANFCPWPRKTIPRPSTIWAPCTTREGVFPRITSRPMSGLPSPPPTAGDSTANARPNCAASCLKSSLQNRRKKRRSCYRNGTGPTAANRPPANRLLRAVARMNVRGCAGRRFQNCSGMIPGNMLRRRRLLRLSMGR